MEEKPGNHMPEQTSLFSRDIIFLCAFLFGGCALLLIPATAAGIFRHSSSGDIDPALFRIAASGDWPAPASTLKPAVPAVMLLYEDRPPDDLDYYNMEKIQYAGTGRTGRNCLAQALYYEARSESLSGRIAVADVILNRVASRLYPDTVCAVVFQGSALETGCQFSFTCDGSMELPLDTGQWYRARELAGIILAGFHVPVTGNATHYHADYVYPYWTRKMIHTRTIGSHIYYRLPGGRHPR